MNTLTQALLLDGAAGGTRLAGLECARRRFDEFATSFHLKTGTSRRLRNEFREHLDIFFSKPTLWSRSYCVLSCGGAPLEIIQRYIQQQERPES